MAKQLRTQVAEMINTLQENGWSQANIAEELGVSQAYVSLLKYKRIQTSLIIANSIIERLQSIFSQYEITTAENEDEISESESGDDNAEDIGTFSDWLNAQIVQNSWKPNQIADASGVSLITIRFILSGRTSNPQSATRGKIEKGIQSLLSLNPQSEGVVQDVQVESTAPVAPEDEIIAGIPFLRDEIERAPNKKGVYAIHDRRGYPVYVGKGNIRTRLLKHAEHRAFLDSRVANNFSYIVLQKSDTVEDIAVANREALRLEKLIVKFCGNTILLNKQLVEDLSDE